MIYENNKGPISCVNTSSLDNKYLISNDNNYYPCDSNEHDINNCLSCNMKDKCLSCKSGYTNNNGNTKCILTFDIEDKK